MPAVNFSLPEGLALTDAQRHVAERASDFAATRLAPAAAGYDAEGATGAHPFPDATLRAMAAEGLLGINISPEFGGRGAGAVGYAVAVRALASACAATTVGLMVSNMVAEAIATYGDAEQHAAWLPRITAGAFSTAGFSLSEPGSGSDAGGLKTVAVRQADGGYVLDGTKSWVTSGGHAGLYLVMASTDAAARTRGISAFLVAADAPGLSVGKSEEKLGQHASTTTQLILDGCHVAADRRLGPEGIGFKIAMSSLDGGRIGVSAQACGIATAALGHLRAHADAHPEHRATVDQCAAELEAAWRLCLRAAWMKDRRQRFTREAAMTKLYCTETAGRICERTVRALGRAGLTAPVEKLLRDARITRIYEGTSEIQRLVIAREVLRAG